MPSDQPVSPYFPDGYEPGDYRDHWPSRREVAVVLLSGLAGAAFFLWLAVLYP